MRTFFLFALLCIALPNIAQRSITTLSTGWKFKKGHTEGASLEKFDDTKWSEVQIPHDWGVDSAFIPDGDGATGKLPWKGEGWYRTNFQVTDVSKKTLLVFDGVMAFPSVYVNGKLAGKWDYGYNSFIVDASGFVRKGENVLAVHADTRNHNSRWYPGAGIYRKVQLISVNPIHFEIWGCHVTTPVIKPHYADVQVSTGIESITGTDSEVLLKQTILSPGNRIVGSQETIVHLKNSRQSVETSFTLSNPKRWDTYAPNLYTLVNKLYQGDQLIDSTTTPFGIRTIRFTANDGFYLNDRRVQLKGVNLHHDLGPLGAAFNVRAMERQLQIMKGMGCNAIRTSHNIPAPELLDLCDRMGLLVINEIFDKYDGKADITDTTDFAEFAERNIRNWIMRDRNHPSIFLWSVGNEIGDVQWNRNNGFWKLRTMINHVRQYDPSRPVTLVCDNQLSAELRHFDFYDVHAWNYGRRYALARQLESTKAVIISESASTVSTRGFYEFPLPAEKTAFTQSMQVSSYDLNAPEWAEISDDDFMWQQDENYIAGEFVWTGFDYLGEPTPYDPWSMKNRGEDVKNASRSSYFGIVDLVGIPKDRYFLYKSYWKPEENTVHILPHWNWPDRIGKNVPVFVYTNGDCAELFLNGKSLGMQCKKPKSRSSTERFRLMWNDVVYEAGELRAVAYQEGMNIGEQTVKTTGDAVLLKLTPDRTALDAGGEDLSFILAEAFDKDGNPSPLAMNALTVKISGQPNYPFLPIVDNGNPRSLQSFQANTVNLFYGKAMIIVRAGMDPGAVKVEVFSPGLKSTPVNLTFE